MRRAAFCGSRGCVAVLAMLGWSLGACIPVSPDSFYREVATETPGVEETSSPVLPASPTPSSSETPLPSDTPAVTFSPTPTMPVTSPTPALPDADEDGWPDEEDCAPGEATVHPEAVEVCDGVDNNCDDKVDEGLTTTFYLDGDGDGAGNGAEYQAGCVAPDGYVLSAQDCNDDNASIHPDAPERCNGVDDNCDGTADNVASPLNYYTDGDGDGYGGDVAGQGCPGEGQTLNGDDCDDTDPDLHPFAAELCNGFDEDCDGQIDDGVTTTYYLDQDADGYGSEAEASVDACSPPAGRVTVPGDCDDARGDISPVAAEVCDGLDNDCDGLFDEEGQATYYPDGDLDGWGDGLQEPLVSDCVTPEDYASRTGDCDDTDAAVYPDAMEICDGQDNDCYGDIDEGVILTYFEDMDQDGFGRTDAIANGCELPATGALQGGDCDDRDPLAYPGADEEVGDGADSNCNGYKDTILALAGTGDPGYSGDGGDALLARFAGPVGMTEAPDGTIYVADTDNHRVRKISPDGVVTTVAGTGIAGTGADNVLATSSALIGPSDVALDDAGNLYISDTGNHRVRRVSPNQVIVTVAGTGKEGDGEGSPANDKRLKLPSGLAWDPRGLLYIVDQGNHKVKALDGSSLVRVAGSSDGYSGDGSPATSAKLKSPSEVVLGVGFELFIADSGNHRIRKVASNGVISTVAGNGSSDGSLGDGGPATKASLSYPVGLAVGTDGELYVADRGHRRIRRVRTGNISTVAGTGSEGDGGDEGSSLQATFQGLGGLCWGAEGQLMLSDDGNNRLRVIWW